MASASRESVLFLTSSEYGQGNVITAVAYEFLLRGEFDVHIASYASLAPRIHWLNEEISRKRENNGSPLASGSKAIFHELAGVSMVDNIKNSNIIWPHKIGINNTMQSFRDMARVVIREDTHNYIKAYDSCLSIIKAIKPSIVVVEPLCLPGTDACQAAANSSSSGHPFPLPFYLIPANIYLFIQLILKFVLGNVASTLETARKAHGITSPRPLGCVADRNQLCPSLPEIDFPFWVIPETVVGCGPIILPAFSMSESDPELAQWLKRYPTVLINLGSNHSTDPDSALEMAHSISALLSNYPKLQVLWKLKYDWQADDEFKSTLRSAFDTERLRVTSWLIPETVSILTSGDIIAFVHHGGANSYYEACYVGVSQVLLPVWYDTYTYAAKVEYLGIGVYGNRSSAPGVSREEFSEALEKVLNDEGMSGKAKAIGKLCGKTVGREVACDKITELARKGKRT